MSDRSFFAMVATTYLMVGIFMLAFVLVVDGVKALQERQMRFEHSVEWHEDMKTRIENARMAVIAGRVGCSDPRKFPMGRMSAGGYAAQYQRVRDHNLLVDSYTKVVFRSTGGSQYRGFEEHLPKHITACESI